MEIKMIIIIIAIIFNVTLGTAIIIWCIGILKRLNEIEISLDKHFSDEEKAP